MIVLRDVLGVREDGLGDVREFVGHVPDVGDNGGEPGALVDFFEEVLGDGGAGGAGFEEVLEDFGAVGGDALDFLG